MEAISLYTAQVPNRVKKVVRYLIKGSREDVEYLLPIELKKIENSSTECLKLAEAVEKKFELVMFLTGELLEASSAARGHYEESQDEAKLNREIALAKQKKELERKEVIKKQQEKLEKQVREAKQTWENAMDSMPNGWSLFGMQFVEGLTNTFSGLLQAVGPFSILQSGGKMIYALLQGFGSQTNPTGSNEANTDGSSKNGSSSQDETSKVSLLGIEVKDLVILMAECLDSAAGETDDNNNLSETLMRIRLLSKNLSYDVRTDSAVNLEIKKILEKSQEICKKGEAWLGQLNPSPVELRILAQQASQLKVQAVTLCAAIKTKTGVNPVYSKPPMQAQRTASSENSAPSSAVNAAVEGARLKITESRLMFEKQERRYDKTLEDLKEINANLQKVLEDLGKFSTKVADFREIRETLTKGMKALASVREQWQKLVEFFQFITNIIKVCMKESLTSFVDYAKVGNRRVLSNGYSDTDFMRDLIYEQVNQANTTSYVVWSLANTYYDISQKYLMGKLASLGHLTALDPEKDRGEIEAKKNELTQGCKEAQEAIMSLVLDAKEKFHAKVAKRINQIETELVKALPAPKDPVKVKEMDEAVKKGIEEGDELVKALPAPIATEGDFTEDDF